MAEEYEGEELMDMYADYYGTDLDTTRELLVIYSSPFLLLLCTVGNLGSFYLLCKQCTHVLSSCVYLAILALVDLVMMYVLCGNRWLTAVSGIDLSTDISTSSMSACKAYFFAFHLVRDLYPWMLVCTAVEGYIAVRFPAKIPRMCTLSRAKAIVLFIVVLLTCFNIHYFWTYQLITLADYEIHVEYTLEERICSSIKQSTFEEEYIPIMNLAISDILPMLLVGTFTLLTAVALCRKPLDKEKQKAEDAWRKRYLLYPDALKQMRLAMWIVCVLYLFVRMPCLVLSIIQHINLQYTFLKMHMLRHIQLAMEVTQLVEYIYFSGKFYIYFAACKKFRDEAIRTCRRLCSCVKHCRYHHQQHSSCPTAHSQASQSTSQPLLTSHSVQTQLSVADKLDSRCAGRIDSSVERDTELNENQHNNVLRRPNDQQYNNVLSRPNDNQYSYKRQHIPPDSPIWLHTYTRV